MLVKMYIILLAFTLAAFKPVFSQTSRKISDNPLSYFNIIIKNIKDDYYFIDKINIDSIASLLRPRVHKAKTVKDTYPVIRDLLSHLYEKHSGFMTPVEALKLFNDTTGIVFPTGSFLKDSIGYIKTPPYTSSEGKMDAWADSLSKKNLSFINLRIRGLIVDLRGNYGGSHLPMIQGIAPLIGEGYIFSETNNRKETDSLFIVNGTLVKRSNGRIMYKFPALHPQMVFASQLKIAVFLDSMTASAGEITTIALKKNKRTKIFGGSSAGYPTLNKVFLMPDNALLYLVNRIIKVTDGNMYLDKIQPDVGINPGAESRIFSEAAMWILSDY